MEEYVTEYMSDEEVENEVPKKRKKRTPIIWNKECSFPDSVSAISAIDQEKCWSRWTNYKDSDGNIIVIYRCNKVKFKGEQCAGRVRLFYVSSSNEVLLYRSSSEHSHALSENKAKQTINYEARMAIKQFVEEDYNVKPKKVIELLAKNKVQLPTRRQVQNTLSKIRNEEFGPTTISLGELEKMLIDNSIIPQDDLQSFVSSYEILHESENNQFRFFVTSKKLLSNAMKVKHLHADATYKLIWQGFPVIVLGSTDMDRSFHCFGMSICSGETTIDYEFSFNALRRAIKDVHIFDFHPSILIADGAPAIQNAFKNVFGDECSILMCWFHMKKNIIKTIDQLITDKSKKSEIISDIEILQLCKNDEIFDKATLLFKDKWNEYANTFIAYFDKQWLNKNRFWYEGAKQLVPSTNNALESFNRVIKDEKTLRERLPISRFFILLLKYVCDWSQEYGNGVKSFKENPTLTLNIWTASYNWARENKDIKIVKLLNATNYLVPGKKLKHLSEDKCMTDISTFDQYKNLCCDQYEVVLNTENYLKSTCDCPAFLKNYMCKHILGLAIRLKLIVPPVEAKNIPIGKKRNVGRPSKAKKALIVQ